MLCLREELNGLTPGELAEKWSWFDRWNAREVRKKGSSPNDSKGDLDWIYLIWNSGRRLLARWLGKQQRAKMMLRRVLKVSQFFSDYTAPRGLSGGGTRDEDKRA